MTEQAASRTTRRIEPWPLIVVGFLLMNVGVCAVTVFAALRHPAIVEPNYYDKALRWDELRELKSIAASARLDIESTETPGVFSLAIRDQAGRVVLPKAFSVVAVHQPGSGGGVEVSLGLRKSSEGRYVSSPPLSVPGVWSVAATVSLDPALDPYSFTTELTIPQ